MNDSWSLNEGKFTMRFSLTVALFIAVGCFSLVGSEPDTPARNATVGTQPGGDTVNSGLEGTTSSVVMSGIPGGKTTGGPASMEIAVAPLEGDKPSFAKAIFVKSDRDGKYRVALPPEKYWIGPKAKAQGATTFPPPGVEFRAKTAVVTEGAFTYVDLSEIYLSP